MTVRLQKRLAGVSKYLIVAGVFDWMELAIAALGLAIFRFVWYGGCLVPGSLGDLRGVIAQGGWFGGGLFVFGEGRGGGHFSAVSWGGYGKAWCCCITLG